MTESEARKAFNTASSELQAALTKYQSARKALHRVTGEFIGADQAQTLQFSSALAASTNDGSATQQALADC